MTFLLSTSQVNLILVLIIILTLGTLIGIFIKEKQALPKVMWTLVVLFIPVAGALVYLLHCCVAYIQSQRMAKV
jgi:hypothetical protein